MAVHSLSKLCHFCNILSMNNLFIACDFMKHLCLMEVGELRIGAGSGIDRYKRALELESKSNGSAEVFVGKKLDYYPLSYFKESVLLA